jgi:hypothetical protein
MNVIARFGVFSVEKIHDEFLRVVTPRSVVVGYQRFRGPLHPEDVSNMDL